MPPINSPEIAQIIRDAALPLDKVMRPALYQAVADALVTEPIVGVGATYRLCRALQRRFLHPLQEAI